MAFDVMGAKQAGYTDQEIQQYLASKGQATTAPQQPEPQKGGGFADLLPLIGAIGGSFTPLGPIGGGIVGAGLGTVGKQLFKGKADPGEIVKESALAGVGGGIGKGIGWGLGKALPAVLEKAGVSAIGSQYGNLGKGVARATKLNKTIPQLAKYGITDINKVVPAAEQVTGESGIVNLIKQRAIANAQPVMLGAPDTATPAIEELAAKLATNPAMGPASKSFTNFIKTGLSDITSVAPGATRGSADPTKTFQLIQKLQAAANDLTGRGRAPTAITSQDRALASGYKKIADELEKRLYDVSGASSQVIGQLTPEEYAALSKISPQLAKDVAGAQTVKELRAIEAPFVKGSQAARDVEAAGQTGFQNIGQTTQGLGKLIPSFARPFAPLQSIAEMPQVNAGLGKGLLGAADLARKIPLPASPTLERMGVGAATGLGGTAGEAQTAEMPNIETPVSTKTPEQAKQEQIRNLFFALMLANPKQAATLGTIFNFGFPQSKMTADMQNKLTALGSVDTYINQFEKRLNTIGTEEGPGARISGLIKTGESILGTNPQVTAYNTAREGLANVLTKALGQVGNLSDKDIERAVKLIPSVYDTREEARLKIEQLREIVNESKVGISNLAPTSSTETSIPMPANLGL